MGHHNHNNKITERFEFTGREKAVLGGLMGLGLLCLIITFFQGGEEDSHLRFWTNFLHNSVFFTGISFIAMFMLAAKVLAYSGWHTVWKRVLEAKAQFLIFGLGMMVLIWLGSEMGWHHLYHWNFPGITDTANEACYDRIIDSKSGFLNSTFYIIATVLFGGIWYACVVMFRKLSLKEDAEGNESYAQHRRMKHISGFFMPFGGFTSAALIWLWVMSIDSHWYSTMFAWYATASWLVSAVAIILLIIIYLKSRGYFSYITSEHVHDLGKYLFGFSIFWTYLWFSQFMLIWYANVGEETIYFNTRMEHYPVIFWVNLAINFVLPLFALVRNDAKRKFGILIFVCVAVIFGHWVDFFMMIKPGAQHTEHEWHEYQHLGCYGDTHHDTKELGDVSTSNGYAKLVSNEQEHGHGEAHAEEHTSHDADHKEEHHGAAAHGHDDTHGAHDAHGHKEGHGEHASHGPEFKIGFTIPGLLEIGTFVGFLALFIFVVFSSLTKARLVPPNDPYLEESLHHHVGYGGGNMEEGHH